MVGDSHYPRQYYPDPVRVNADGSFWPASTLARTDTDEELQEKVEAEEQEEEEEQAQGQGRLLILESDQLRTGVAILGQPDANGNSNSHESFGFATGETNQRQFEHDQLERLDEVEVNEVEQDELKEASFDTKFVEDRDDR